MLSRIIVGILGIFILLILFIKGGLFLLIFTEVVVLISCFEFLTMLKRKYGRMYLYRPLIVAFIIPILVYLNVDISYILILLFLVLAITEILMVHIKNSLSKLSVSLFMIIYISLMFSFLLKIDKLDKSSAIIMFAFFLTWAADTFAYIFGMLLGRHKFSIISPNKSIEGLIGGFVGVLIISRYFGYIYYFITYIFSLFKIFGVNKLYVEFFNSFSLKLIAFSIVIFALSVLGDLFESKIKRELDAKDSSHLLLGHGGFLDRFDSSLFVIPAVYLFFNIMM